MKKDPPVINGRPVFIKMNTNTSKTKNSNSKNPKQNGDCANYGGVPSAGGTDGLQDY